MNAKIGTFEIPTIVESVELPDLNMSWPSSRRAVYDPGNGTPQARIDFESTPLRWVTAGSGLIVGIAEENRLATLVLPQLDVGLGEQLMLYSRARVQPS